MGFWNYRIIKYMDGRGYGLHEVHYDENGSVRGYAECLATFYVSTEDDELETDEKAQREMIRDIARALADAAARDILDERVLFRDKGGTA